MPLVDLLDKFSEQAPLAALSLAGAYILWKRYDKFIERTQVKLDAAEKRIQEIMENGYSKLIVMAETQQRIIVDNTEAMKAIQRSMERNSSSMERNSRIMECVMSEIKDARRQRRAASNNPTSENTKPQADA